MAGSVNTVILVGNLGRDPEGRDVGNGGRVVSFSIATSETWKDKNGERQEKTQWHRVAIWNEKLGEIAEKYLKKGSKVFVQGSLETRKYTDKDGNERESTEVVLGRFRGELTLLDSAGGSSQGGGSGGSGGSGFGGRANNGGRGSGQSRYGSSGGGGRVNDDFEDSIPFAPQWQ